MEPDSATTIVAVLLAATTSLVLLGRARHVWVKIASGVLAMVLCIATGIAVVNDYYGYYTSWGQLTADLSGRYQALSRTPQQSRHVGAVVAGRLEQLRFAGARSGIDRDGLVYLPPQYFQRSYAHTRFPVVELLHGTPGTPSNWTIQLGLAHLMDRLLTHHEIGPMILVMPMMSAGRHFEECVDAPGALDDTYITQDVRHDVLDRFRALPYGAAWGVAGYSSGGYCAANLALRHPADFGAAGVMDGYYRPSDGPAAAALHHSRTAENANDPLLEAARLGRDSHPLPSFWVSAGSGDAADLAAAQAFTTALHGVEQVVLYREPGARHNFDAWRPAIPRLLAWMWGQLAPPQLRVNFPISGPVHDATIAVGASDRAAPAAPARSPHGRHDGKPAHRA